jgi:hypothetical protein
MRQKRLLPINDSPARVVGSFSSVAMMQTTGVLAADSRTSHQSPVAIGKGGAFKLRRAVPFHRDPHWLCRFRQF